MDSNEQMFWMTVMATGAGILGLTIKNKII